MSRHQRQRRGDRRVPLPVLDDGRRERPIPRPARLARWRAAGMVLLYVAIAAHLVHWAMTGRSVGRLVMSDSMRTLELGEVNPGFLLFAAVLLGTVLVGRFFCGWACHMGALQDLCGWIMRRAGLRPTVFHSRVLGYVPIGMALYMFIWPSFRRLVAEPALGALFPGQAWLEPSPPFPGFHLALTSDRLWEGLPSAWVGVPFLLLCGFGTVYFLGARGLCRYACPYGGLILQAERLAPGRIVVDPVRCDQCGLCTAACTAGVRVHDDVRLYGRVVDKNCVRSLDCVTVCPKQALRLGVAAPSLFKGSPKEAPARRVYDLTLWEEGFALAVFLATFFIARGLYGVVPMLLAGTVGVLAAFLAVTSWRLCKRGDVRFRGLQLRAGGRLTGHGVAFLAAIISGAALLTHSGVVRALLWRAGQIDERVTVAFEEALAGQAPQDQRRTAEAATRLYTLARDTRHGGIALADTPEGLVRLAWLQLVVGDAPACIATLSGLIERGGAPDQVGVGLARVLLARGEGARAEGALGRVVQGGNAPASRAMLSDLLMARGDLQAAEDLLRTALAGSRTQPGVVPRLAIVLARKGNPDDSLAVLRFAAGPERAAARAIGIEVLSAFHRKDEAAAWARAFDGR